MRNAHLIPAGLLPLLVTAAVAACDSATAPDITLAAEPVLASALGSDGMVPLNIRETAMLAPDATMVLCEPVAAGVALPDRLIATGQGSHLGKVSSLVVGESCALDLETGVLSVAGTGQHTAANGDILEATWNGTLVGSDLSLDVAIIGGTGRFEGVTGWATLTGSMDLGSLTGDWEITGRITPPGY